MSGDFSIEQRVLLNLMASGFFNTSRLPEEPPTVIDNWKTVPGTEALLVEVLLLMTSEWTLISPHWPTILNGLVWSTKIDTRAHVQIEYDRHKSFATNACVLSLDMCIGTC